MNTVVKSVIFLFALFLLGACSITKRIHNHGWQVEWKSNQKAVNTETEVSSVDQKQAVCTPTKSEISLSEESENIVLAETEKSQIENHSTSTDVGKDHLAPKVKVASQDQTEYIQPKREHRDESQVRPDVDNRKIHPYLFVSFGFFMGSVLSIILLVCGIFEVLIGILLLMLFLIAFFGLLSFIFAVIANREIKKSPELWKGESGAKALVIFGIMFSLGAVVVAVGLWLLLLSILSLFL